MIPRENNRLINKKICLCTLILFLSGGLFIPFISTDETGATVPDSHEKTIAKAPQEISSTLALINITVNVLVYPGHHIEGTIYPEGTNLQDTADGRYMWIRIVATEWTNETIIIHDSKSWFPYCDIPDFQGVSVGLMGWFMGILDVKNLLGITSYLFRGVAFSLYIPSVPWAD